MEKKTPFFPAYNDIKSSLINTTATTNSNYY